MNSYTFHHKTHPIPTPKTHPWPANSLAATDSRNDEQPAIAYGGGIFVLVWHSNNPNSGSGMDFDIASTTSPDGQGCR